MTIFESWHSSRAFGRELELPLLMSMGRVLAVVLSVYLWIRFLDLSHRHAFALLAQNRMETWLFALEIALLVGAHGTAVTSRGSGRAPAVCTPAQSWWCSGLSPIA